MMNNIKKTRSLAILLGMIMLLSTVFAACVNLDEVPEIDHKDLVDDTSNNGDEATDDQVDTQEGYTAAPQNVVVENLEPTVVAISGNCEAGATIRVVGGVEEVTTVANGTHFIIKTELPYKEVNKLTVTATANGNKESVPVIVDAKYDATAEPSINNNVSVGLNSQLYLTEMAKGEALYSPTELEKIKNYVNRTAYGYYLESVAGKDVELIYVLVPSVTSVYDDIVPDGVVDETKDTVYNQVLNTLKNDTIATVVDMREVFKNELANSESSEYGRFYRTTDSHLSDYGAYLTYKSIMDVVDDRFAAAAAHGIDEFDWTKETTLGGDLIKYSGFDKEILTEEIMVATPKFSLDVGKEEGRTKRSIASLTKYISLRSKVKDYGIFDTIDSKDGIDGLAELWEIHTDRGASLPNAIIYRDNSSIPFVDILAERFNKCRLERSGSYNIDMSMATTYKSEGNDVVDYIIVVVSEENMDTAFSAAFN